MRASSETEIIRAGRWCLVDGVSWVIAGELKHGVAKERTSVWKEEEILYIVDEATEAIRRQSVNEVKQGRIALKENQGKVMDAIKGANYMPVVRYLM